MFSLALASALALQAPKTEPKAPTTNSTATTSEAPKPLLPATRATSKQGFSVVALAGPTTPWAVAQLHVRLAPDLTPAARAATTTWALLIADAGRRFVGSDGAVEVRVDGSSVVVSYGVEAARVDDALRAVDAALKARPKPLAPTAVPPTVARLIVDETGVKDASIEGGAYDAAAAKAFAGVSADRVAVVVVGADSGASLVARVSRVVTAPVARAAAATAPTIPTGIVERDGTGFSSTLTWWTPARTDAGLLVLAELLGGRIVTARGLLGLSLDVAGADRASLLAAEDAAVAKVRLIAEVAPPHDVVDEAAAAATTKKLSTLTSPSRVAFAVGRAALEQAPTRLEDEIAALSSTNPSSVAQAASSLASTSIVRTGASP